MKQTLISVTGNHDNAVETTGEHGITQTHTRPAERCELDVSGDKALNFTTPFPSESTASQRMPHPNGWDEVFACYGIILMNAAAFTSGIISPFTQYIIVCNPHITLPFLFIVSKPVDLFYAIKQMRSLQGTYLMSYLVGSALSWHWISFLELVRFYFFTELSMFGIAGLVAYYFVGLGIILFKATKYTPAPRLVCIETNPGPSHTNESDLRHGVNAERYLEFLNLVAQFIHTDLQSRNPPEQLNDVETDRLAIVIYRHMRYMTAPSIDDLDIKGIVSILRDDEYDFDLTDSERDDNSDIASEFSELSMADHPVNPFSRTNSNHDMDPYWSLQDDLDGITEDLFDAAHSDGKAYAAFICNGRIGDERPDKHIFWLDEAVDRVILGLPLTLGAFFLGDEESPKNTLVINEGPLLRLADNTSITFRLRADLDVHWADLETTQGYRGFRYFMCPCDPFPQPYLPLPANFLNKNFAVYNLIDCKAAKQFLDDDFDLCSYHILGETPTVSMKTHPSNLLSHPQHEVHTPMLISYLMTARIITPTELHVLPLTGDAIRMCGVGDILNFLARVFPRQETMPPVFRLDVLTTAYAGQLFRHKIEKFFIGLIYPAPDKKGYKKILVGIETNPGPTPLMSYLKNMDKLNASAPTLSSRSNFSTKEAQRLEKLKKKNETRKVMKGRDVKYHPEGLFDVGISEESREFIGDAIQQIREVFNKGAKLEVDLGVRSAFMDILEGAKKVGGIVYDFIMFLLRSCIDLMPEHVADVITSILSLVIGDIFVDAPEEEIEGDFVEEGLVTDCMFTAYSRFMSKYVPTCDMLEIWKSGLRVKNLAKDSAPMFGWFFSIIKKTIMYLNDKFPEIISLPGCLFSGDIAYYFKSLQEIRADIRTGTIPVHVLALKIYALQDKIELDFRENPKTADSASYAYLLTHVGNLAKFFDSHVAPRSGCRSEPLGIMITGPSNVGKSTFTIPLLLAIMARTKSGQALKDFLEDHLSTVFFRIALNEFWDGMRPNDHTVIVYDDFGQLADAVGSPNMDALEWIHLKNTAPFHLHYSNISDKSKHYATPQIVFGSTNRPIMNFSSIINNEALIRRFDIAVCQLPKRKYCIRSSITSNPWTRKMDMAKVRKDFPLDPLNASTYADSSVLEYIEWDFAKGCPKYGGFILSFDELVELGANMLTNFNNRGKHMLGYHSFIKRRFGDITLKEEEEATKLVPAVEEVDGKTLPQYVDEMTDWVSTINTNWKELYDNTLSYWKPIAATLTMVCGVTSLYSSLSAWKTESNGSRKPTTKRPTKTHVPPIKVHIGHVDDVPHPVVYEKEGSHNPTCDYLWKVARRNQFVMSVNEEKPFCQAVFIAERVFMMPRHSFESVKRVYDEQSKYVEPGRILLMKINFTGIISKQVEICVSIHEFDVWAHPTKDLVLVRLPRESCRLFSRLIGAFLKRDESKSDENFSANILYSRDGDVRYTLCSTNVTYANTKYSSDGGWSARLHYNAPSQVGDCGAPLITNDPRFCRPIILGMHVAGGGGIFQAKMCLAAEVFQEELEIALEHLNAGFEYRENIPVPPMPPYELEGFSTYGPMPIIYAPTKTCILPSPFHGGITEVTTSQAPLVPIEVEGEIVDPRIKARDKYAHPETYIDRISLKRAVASVTRLILPDNGSRPWEPKVLSFEDAVGGVQGVAYMEALNRSTSPGYPYNMNRKLPGKKDWLGDGDVIDFADPRVVALKAEVMDTIAKIRSGERQFFPFIDHLKDERVSHEKARIGKTRQFMVGNLLFTILIKMYFGDYIRHICSNRLINGIAIGVDAFTEWDMLFRIMTAIEQGKMTAGDYSAYDAKIPVPISMGQLDVAESFYYTSSEDDRYIREILMQEVVNSAHINMGILYYYNGGNPSGNGMTTVHNSVCGLIMLFYIAYVASDVTEEMMFQMTRFMVFGDDNLITYHPNLASIFEQSNISILMKLHLNMSYTVETKDGSEVTARSIWEVNFLKRGFLKVRGNLTCPLELGVILETLNWYKKGSTRTQMIERIDAYFCELARHGKKVFEQWSVCVDRLSAQHYQYSSIYKDYLIALQGLVSYNSA